MKIYFLSSQPCALSLNGVYFGVTDNFERFADVCLSDRVFAKFTPEGRLPIAFFITEEILHTPPLGCEVYIMKDSIAIFARDFPPIDFTLRPISQERFGNLLATLYQQGNVQLSLQTPENFVNAYLPPSFAHGKLSFHSNLCFVEGENCLAIYTKQGKCVFMEEIIAFEVVENELNATLPLSDALSRTAECRYALHESGCTRTHFSIKQPCAENETARQKLAEELLPYAFFESVLIGANYADFLCEDLLPNAEKIVAFLGDFKAVTLTNDPFTCGLVREKAPRLFEVAYYTVTIKNDKITDVHG